MKIRTKLILSFCIVIFVPVCLMIFTSIGIFGSQNNLIMNENRNIKNAEKYWLNSDEIYSASSSMDEYYWKIDSEIKKKATAQLRIIGGKSSESQSGKSRIDHSKS